MTCDEFAKPVMLALAPFALSVTVLRTPRSAVGANVVLSVSVNDVPL